MLELSERLPTMSEQLSRGYAFSVGLEMGENFLRLEGDQLYNFASKFVQRTMYGYNTVNRSKVIGGPLGGLVGLFKNWSIHYMANMMTYAGEMTRGDFAPFLYMMAGTGAITGAGGIAGYGAIDGLSKIFADRPFMDLAYDKFGYGEGSKTKDVAIDTWMYGLPALMQIVPGVPAVALQGRAAAPFSDPARDISQLFSIPIMDRAVAGKEFLGTVISDWSRTGRHPSENGQAIDKLKRFLLPRTLYKGLSFTQDNALKSLKTGNRLISDTTVPQRVLHSLGFTPIEFQKAFEVNDFVRTSQAKQRALVSSFGRALAEGMSAGAHPSDQMQLIRRAFLIGLDVNSVINSSEAHYRNITEDMISRAAGRDDYDVFKMRQRIGLK
jgi:hypothetical protein